MDYYLVSIDGQMGFVYARDTDQAANRAARDFGYEDAYHMDGDEIDVQSLDSVNLEDVRHIIGFGGYVPLSVRQHFGIV